MWCDYYENMYKKFKVAINNVFRKMFNFDRMCSVSREMRSRHTNTVSVKQRKLTYRMYKRIMFSDEKIVEKYKRK